MSIRPGVMSRPAMSTTVCASRGSDGPVAAIRPPVTATSNGSPPVNSRSQVTRSPCAVACAKPGATVKVRKGMALIPRPLSFVPGEGLFELRPDTPLTAGEGLDGVAGWLRDAIGCPLPPGDGGIRLSIDKSQPLAAYAVSIAPGRLEISGGDAAGVFHGAQTLRQLLPPESLRRGRAGDQRWT